MSESMPTHPLADDPPSRFWCPPKDEVRVRLTAQNDGSGRALLGVDRRIDTPGIVPGERRSLDIRVIVFLWRSGRPEAITRMIRRYTPEGAR